MSVLVCRFAQVALLTVALCPSLAEASPTTSVVLSPPASRVVLSACSLVVAPNGNASVTFSATNEHPKLALERVRVVLRVKNDLDQKIGQFSARVRRHGSGPRARRRRTTSRSTN